MNAYYGLYLLGKARGSAGLADWGRVLLATEVRSAQRYWHIRAAVKPQVYPQPFAANKVVGVLWNSLVRPCIRIADHGMSTLQASGTTIQSASGRLLGRIMIQGALTSGSLLSSSRLVCEVPRPT